MCTWNTQLRVIFNRSVNHTAGEKTVRGTCGRFVNFIPEPNKWLAKLNFPVLIILKKEKKDPLSKQFCTVNKRGFQCRCFVIKSSSRVEYCYFDSFRAQSTWKVEKAGRPSRTSNWINDFQLNTGFNPGSYNLSPFKRCNIIQMI